MVILYDRWFPVRSEMSEVKYHSHTPKDKVSILKLGPAADLSVRKRLCKVLKIHFVVERPPTCSAPFSGSLGGKMRDPGNEVATC